MYNKITLMGRLVAAPELKTTQNGIPYTRFRIPYEHYRYKTAFYLAVDERKRNRKKL